MENISWINTARRTTQNGRKVSYSVNSLYYIVSVDVLQLLVMSLSQILERCEYISKPNPNRNCKYMNSSVTQLFIFLSIHPLIQLSVYPFTYTSIYPSIHIFFHCPFLQGHDGSRHYLIQAKVAILNKQFKQAERLLLERGDAQQAMDMYKELGRWEDAITVAEMTVSNDTIVLLIMIS